MGNGGRNTMQEGTAALNHLQVMCQHSSCFSNGSLQGTPCWGVESCWSPSRKYKPSGCCTPSWGTCDVTRNRQVLGYSKSNKRHLILSCMDIFEDTWLIGFVKWQKDEDFTNCQNLPSWATSSHLNVNTLPRMICTRCNLQDVSDKTFSEVQGFFYVTILGYFWITQKNIYNR